MAQSVTYASVAIATALAGAGVWSLVAGQVAGTLVFASIYMLLEAPYRVRPSFDRRAARETIEDGRGFLAQSGVGFVETKADYMAVGRPGDALRWVSAQWHSASRIPYWAVARSSPRGTETRIARMKHRGESVTASFLSVLTACGPGRVSDGRAAERRRGSVHASDIRRGMGADDRHAGDPRDLGHDQQR